MTKRIRLDAKPVAFGTEINSVDTTTYTVSTGDYLKWIKVNTAENTVTITLPELIYVGFTCFIENVGVGSVVLVAENLSAVKGAADFVEDQYRSVQVVHEGNGEWRAQGYLGRNDINALYDVNFSSSPLETHQVIMRDQLTGFWLNKPYLPFWGPIVSNIGILITTAHHGRVIIINAGTNQTISINNGLPNGLFFTVVNTGSAAVNIACAGTLNSPTTNLTQWQWLNFYHTESNIWYSYGNF